VSMMHPPAVAKQYAVGELIENVRLTGRFPWLLAMDPIRHLLEIPGGGGEP
jgi:hypothetical protein